MTALPRGIESALARALAAWVGGVTRAPVAVLLAAAALTVYAAGFVGDNLGMNTETTSLFSSRLEWRQVYQDYEDAFPASRSTLDVVIDAATPDLAAVAAEQMVRALAGEVALFERVEQRAGGPFFERAAFLYLDLVRLEALLEDLARAQALLGALAADPTFSNLLGLVRRALVEGGDLAAPGVERVLDAIATAGEALERGRAHPVSWQSLAVPTLAGERVAREFIVVKPRLDYGDLMPAAPAMARIREVARELDLTPARGVRVRITGSNAMETEELESVSRGARTSGVLALVMVMAVLLWGLRSVYLLLASLVTLLVGLLWTAAYAAAAVGHLNVISVAFAVLYIGLGVDYAIHFCLRYRELVAGGLERRPALVRGAGDVGASLAVCAATTGIGFYAFVPTDFGGVSELGAISGTGMFISLFVSVTVLPAMLVCMPAPCPTGAPAGLPWPRASRMIACRPGRILAVALALAAISLLALPRVKFDGNPLNLRDPRSESVATYRDLLADSETTPWTLDVLLPDASALASLRARLEALPEVESTVALDDLVPVDQAEKLELIEDLALLYGDSLGGSTRGNGPAGDVTMAANALLETLRAGPGEVAAAPAARLSTVLERLLARPDAGAALDRLGAAVMAALPAQIDRLSAALGAEPITRQTLPPALVADWLAVDGRPRVAILPREDLFSEPARERFIAAVGAVAPRATGTPLVLQASGRVVVSSFQQAFLGALILIAMLLAVLLGRPMRVALVLAPLLLASLVTLAGMVALGVAFNFANVIALPLLLGAGVDSAVHLVHRARAAPPGDGDLFATSTMRGVVVSTLTTVCSFGNLILSPHPGTASMGLVLSVGMLSSLAATLVVLPALLARFRRLAR